MGDQSQIQWTDATWNPVTGCSKVSPGCAHCYAERVAIRLWPKQYPRVVIDGGITSALRDSVQSTRPRVFTDVQCHEDRIDQPLRWKRPRKVFVNSMSDLFHEDVSDAFIDRVFAVMALAPQHTFQILTKRAERMRDYMSRPDLRQQIVGAAHGFAGRPSVDRWSWVAERLEAGEMLPLPNVWLGVSVENQHFADERIPLLLQTPAAVRFISAEPLLARVNVGRYVSTTCCGVQHQPSAFGGEPWRVGPVGCTLAFKHHGDHVAEGTAWDDVPAISWAASAGDDTRLDWVIVGGESGARAPRVSRRAMRRAQKLARPFDVAWARSIVSQCQAAGVPVFVKQLGADPRGWCSWPHHDENPPAMLDQDGTLTSVSGRPGTLQHALGEAFWPCSPKLRDRKGGDMAEWLEDLRVREMPEAVRA